MNDRTNDTRLTSRPFLAVSTALIGLAGVSLALAIAAAVLRSLDPPAAEAAPSARIVEPLLLLGLGLVSAGLMVGLAFVIRAYTRLQELLLDLEDRLSHAVRESSMPRPVGLTAAPGPGVSENSSAALVTQLQEISLLLRDIRDNSLLSEEERRQKASHVVEDDIADAEQRFRSFLSEGRLGEARDLADSMARRFPENPQVRAWPAQLEKTREQTRSGDVAATTKEVNDLISMSSWTRARGLAQQLFDRHPDSLEARQLLVRIERECKLADDEQRRRMYAEVQRYVTRRRWEEALAAARTFIERFPMSAEAEALRVEVPTLTTNAEIEIRQQLESQIMDWAKHGRYIEAAALARTVIEKYPDSPQAEALRTQLHRLDELANDPAAPPARVRLE